MLLLSGVLMFAACGGGDAAGPDAQGSDDDTSTFSKSYGGPLHDEARVVFNTADGGFMLLGNAEGHEIDETDSPTGADLWMQKLDANGNVEVNRVFGTQRLRTDVDWRLVRPLADGGVVLTGARKHTETVTRPDGTAVEVTVDNDIAIARFGPSGNVEWNVSHDSGEWQNYEYFAANGTLAAANDRGLDVWPASDGGFYVAALSTANLQDTLNIGFPCGDEPVNDLGDSRCGAPLPGGRQFMDAFSIVILRVNADGGFRWRTRLTDNAFVDGNFDESGSRRDGDWLREQRSLGMLVRETAQGGVVLARSVAGGLLVHRVGGDASRLWRVAVPGMEAPSALIQTSDHGFVIVGRDRAIKLNADGEVQWNTDLANGDEVEVNDAAEYCVSGSCYVFAVGAIGNEARARVARAWLLDDAGGIEARAGIASQATDALIRIARRSQSNFELLGVDDDGRLFRTDLPLSAPFSSAPLPIQNYRAGNETVNSFWSPLEPLPELRADGGILRLANRGAMLRYFDSQAQLESSQSLLDIRGSEILRGGAQIAPGRFVLTGVQRDNDNGSRVIAMRYDLDASGERLVWQRVVLPDTRADVIATVATSDGGIAMSLNESTTESGAGGVIKLNADGELLGGVILPRIAAALHPTADGGVAALSLGGIVTRLSAGGQMVWQRRVTMTGPPGHFTALTSTIDGGVQIAGTAGGRLSLVKLGADGTLGAAREVPLHRLSPSDMTFEDLRIRQVSDGSFVLAMTETRLLTTPPDNSGGQWLPFGQSNVFVLKLDAQYQPLWGRVYGARFAERVSDLALRGDGTIAIAGYSESLGDLREAWLLKLSSEGLINGSGCQALLTSLPGPVLPRTLDRDATAEVTQLQSEIPALSSPREASFPMRSPQDFVTARQCLGNSGTTPVTPVETRSLTVVQDPAAPGVVTSEPRGISCGTGGDGGPQFCVASFPVGSRISLRAEGDRFLRWDDPCDEGTGGEQRVCVIRLDSDRRVRSVFRPLPSTGVSLSVEIQGPGTVRAAPILCHEETQPAGCTAQFPPGSLIEIHATPDPDWLGSGRPATFIQWSGDSECTAIGEQLTGFIPMNRDVRCIAQFRAPNLRLIRFTVSEGGTVTNDPPRGDLSGLHCRQGLTGSACQASFATTTEFPVLATPDFGRRFAGWGGDCASYGTDRSPDIEVANNMNCTATFIQGTTSQTLRVDIQGGSATGVVTALVNGVPAGISCSAATGSDCSEDYPPGTGVVLSSNLANTVFLNCDDLTRDQLGFNLCHVNMDENDRFVLVNFPTL